MLPILEQVRNLLNILLISSDPLWSEDARIRIQDAECEALVASTGPDTPPPLHEIQQVSVILIHIEQSDRVPSWIPGLNSKERPILLCSSDITAHCHRFNTHR